MRAESEKVGKMAMERDRLKRIKEVEIISREPAVKRFSDHEDNMFRQVLSSEQAGKLGMERNLLKGLQEEVTMVMRNNENQELSSEISEEIRTSKSEKFERIFNFWENKGDKVGRDGMLLLPGENLGIRERKRKRDPSRSDSESIPEGPHSADEMYSAKRSKNILSKEDWTERNTGIFTNRLGEFGPRWNSDRGEQGELDTQKKEKNIKEIGTPGNVRD